MIGGRGICWRSHCDLKYGDPGSCGGGESPSQSSPEMSSVSSAGADIKEMQNKQFHEVSSGGFLENWGQITEIRKPIIAAVNGYAVRRLVYCYAGENIEMIAFSAGRWNGACHDLRYHLRG